MKKPVRPLRIEIHLRPAHLGALLAALLVCGGALVLDSETLTMSTTYPAPAGVYQSMVVTGRTLLARDTALNGGQVGIGTNAPAALLDVNGQVRVGNMAADPGAGAEGALYYNTGIKDFRAFRNGAWSPLTLGGFSRMRIFSNSGTFTVPATVSRIMVELWGGGAGGSTECFPQDGIGGGGGGYARGVFSVTPGAAYPVVIGYGGVPGPRNNWNATQGGWTFFGNILYAPGGWGFNGGSLGAVYTEGANTVFIPGHDGVNGIGTGIAGRPIGGGGSGGSAGGNGGAGGVSMGWNLGPTGEWPGGGGATRWADCNPAGVAGNGAPGGVIVYW